MVSRRSTHVVEEIKTTAFSSSEPSRAPSRLHIIHVHLPKLTLRHRSPMVAGPPG